MQKQARRTGEGFFQREKERGRDGGRFKLFSQEYFHTTRCARAVVSVSGVRPKLRCGRNRSLLRYRHATHYASAEQCTCDFCGVRKKNHAARVACNQSHAVTREMHCSLRSAARGYAPSIVNIARGHSCDDKDSLLVHFSPLAPCIVKENSSLYCIRGLRRRADLVQRQKYTR